MNKSILFLTIHPKSVYGIYRNGDKRNTGSEPHDGTVFGANDACERLKTAFNPDLVEIDFNVK